jgi:soluble lytic murein transglycosylase
MKAYRAALLAAAALALDAGAHAQTSPQAQRPAAQALPPGLVRSGGTIMMQPIADSTDDTGGESVPAPEAPSRVSLTPTLSASDHDLYEKAFQAGDRGDWIAARGLADQGHDPVARRIITWRYLTDQNGGASFEEIAAFLRDYPDWPLRHVLYARAEHTMLETMAPSAVIAWFGDRTPETGIGKVRLGEALIATGSRTQGREFIRSAWIEDSFLPAEELDIVQRHGDILTPDVDRERLNHLIWRDDIPAARREMSRVSTEAQQVAQVRMALRTNPGAGERMISDLPASLRNNPGVLFDQARSLSRSGDDDEVPTLLIKAPTAEMAKINPGRWWGELSLAARESLKDGNASTAYRLVSDTGLTDGESFAEAEFMAGWIALRYLHQPGEALAHFRKLALGVSRPISLGRAHYWAGRAYEAKGDLANAAREYRLAAQNPETFYGQLALTRIDPDPRLKLKETPAAVSRARDDFESDPLTHAIRVLADLGQERFIRLFAVHEVELHPDAAHVSLLASDLVRMGFREIAVRVAKEASYDGIDLPDYSHPVIALPAYRGPGDAPESALVLGLIRQETEFNPDAVSGVGARGIMQLMPSTARDMARLSGLTYRNSDLVSDTAYNMQLGMTELSTDLATWNGSYILAAAAYNAGPNNVKRWIANYGDPRSPSVDPIDWIEEIPYSETRNYVQRVIENTQVYRNRLTGRSEPLRILADIYRPNVPPSASVLPVAPEVVGPATLPVPSARPEHADAAGTADQTRTAQIEPASSVPQPDARPGGSAVVTPTQRPDAAIIPKEKPAR